VGRAGVSLPHISSVWWIDIIIGVNAEGTVLVDLSSVEKKA
jgi:hypothetical protein